MSESQKQLDPLKLRWSVNCQAGHPSQNSLNYKLYFLYFFQIKAHLKLLRAKFSHVKRAVKVQRSQNRMISDIFILAYWIFFWNWDGNEGIYRRGMRRLTRIEKLNTNTIAQNKNWRKLTRKIRRQIFCSYFFFFLHE